MSDKRTVKQIAAELITVLATVEKAATDWEAARRREAVASRDTTIALNALNTAQKEVDNLYDELRKTASGGDWTFKRGPGRTTEC